MEKNSPVTQIIEHVIEKEREMLSKIEELRNALDEAKEEKYNLRLQLTKLQK